MFCKGIIKKQLARDFDTILLLPCTVERKIANECLAEVHFLEWYFSMVQPSASSEKCSCCALNVIRLSLYFDGWTFQSDLYRNHEEMWGNRGRFILTNGLLHSHGNVFFCCFFSFCLFLVLQLYCCNVDLILKEELDIFWCMLCCVR